MFSVKEISVWRRNEDLMVILIVRFFSDNDCHKIFPGRLLYYVKVFITSSQK